MTMTLEGMFRTFKAQNASREVFRLRQALQRIAHEIGGDPDRPQTVVEAAQSLRAAFARARGYRHNPLTDHVPYSERGW